MNATHPIHTAEQALQRLAGLPGGPELLAEARKRDDIALVGGAVRDLLLGHWPRELDVTVAEDSAGLAGELAASVSPSERAYGRGVEPVLHERFGTASVVWPYGRIDVAQRRAEVYPAPGALPEVRPGTIEEDLARRDFTVNAIALPLAGEAHGRLIAVDGALEDLASGRLRVLHGRSFVEDPTRVLRLARYAARLRFEIEPRTRELAERAVAQGALDTVSGGRLGAELWLAAREADGRSSLRALDSLGVLGALGMPSPFDDALAEAALALLPDDGSPAALLMAVALLPPPDVSAAVAERLAFTREQSAAVGEAARAAAWLAEQMAGSDAAAVQDALDEHSLETAAIAAALAGRASEGAVAVAREWLQTQRHVRLEIDGHDLLGAGVPEGPEVRLRLRHALASKRRGLAGGREQELRAALDYEPPPPAERAKA